MLDVGGRLGSSRDIGHRLLLLDIGHGLLLVDGNGLVSDRGLCANKISIVLLDIAFILVAQVLLLLPSVVHNLEDEVHAWDVNEIGHH